MYIYPKRGDWMDGFLGWSVGFWVFFMGQHGQRIQEGSVVYIWFTKGFDLIPTYLR